MSSGKRSGLGFTRRGARMATMSADSSVLLAMGKTHTVEVQLKVGEPDDDMPEEWGPNLFLNIMSGNRYVGFGLTTHTAHELRTLQRIINLSLDTALEIAIKRDQIAEEEAANGDDSLHRLHRGLPGFLVRTGVEHKHNPCVCNRRETLVVRVDSPGESTPPEHGVTSSEVAEQRAEHVGSADDHAQGDQYEVVSGVAGHNETTGEVSDADGSTTGAAPTP